ncbi:MAG TPA: FHA domain-containing protein [Gemmataceae bacterium]|jgi:pSer/pThr/pTyr-binding forkhead associated (FHA) protein|nr:FHA domain-containing protein [Gemmataceae bacterium]
MSAIVTLSVAEPDCCSEEFSFETPDQCLVGRSGDCDIQLPSDPLHADVSRHHCVFEIEPPHVRVRDLGSLNGTYVNDEKIGQRRPGQEPHNAVLEQYTGRELNDGDRVRVGGTLIRVGVLMIDWQPEPLSSIGTE